MAENIKCKYCGVIPNKPGSHHKKSCKRYEIELMSSSEFKEKMRLGEKLIDAKMDKISKIDWYTGKGSGDI